MVITLREKYRWFCFMMWTQIKGQFSPGTTAYCPTACRCESQLRSIDKWTSGQVGSCCNYRFDRGGRGWQDMVGLLSSMLFRPITTANYSPLARASRVSSTYWTSPGYWCQPTPEVSGIKSVHCEHTIKCEERNASVVRLRRATLS